MAGSCATGGREPGQDREVAAFSGTPRVPQTAWPSPHRPRADTPAGTLLRDLGGVRERPNRHAWKACVGQPTVGSNPTPSARSERRPTQVVTGVSRNGSWRAAGTGDG